MTRPISTNYDSMRIGAALAPGSGRGLQSSQPASSSMFSGDDSFYFDFPSAAKQTVACDASSQSGDAEDNTRVFPVDAAAGRSRDSDLAEVYSDGSAHTEASHDRRPLTLVAAGLAMMAGLVACGWLLLGRSDLVSVDPLSLATLPSGTTSVAATPPLTAVIKARLAEEVGARDGVAGSEPQLARTALSESGVAGPLSLGEASSMPADARSSSGDHSAPVATTDHAQKQELTAFLAPPHDNVLAQLNTSSLVLAGESTYSLSSNANGATPGQPESGLLASQKPAETPPARVAGHISAPPSVASYFEEKKTHETAVPLRTISKSEGAKELFSGELRSLMALGRGLINSGNIAAARAVLTLAAETQDKDAFFALAETYDPAALSRWGVIGVRADNAVAQKFYQLAALKGLRLANDRLASLKP